MMFWMYCPILTPNSARETVPTNLRQFCPILNAVMKRERHARGKYVYLTAKTLWVSEAYIGNRPGWHSDGFGTSDINYIWYDRAPTQFLDCPPGFDLPGDCDDAMERMARQADCWPLKAYPNKHLLRLTPACIHRSPVNVDPGVRSFVKVSISVDRYNLAGNSLNHGLSETWTMLPREVERNHPSRQPASTAAAPVDRESQDEPK